MLSALPAVTGEGNLAFLEIVDGLAESMQYTGEQHGRAYRWRCRSFIGERNIAISRWSAGRKYPSPVQDHPSPCVGAERGHLWGACCWFVVRPGGDGNRDPEWCTGLG